VSEELVSALLQAAAQSSQGKVAECVHSSCPAYYSRTLADLLRFAFRHLLPVEQLQLWRLRLRDLNQSHLLNYPAVSVSFWSSAGD
jgi:hypothetical protein